MFRTIAAAACCALAASAGVSRADPAPAPGAAKSGPVTRYEMLEGRRAAPVAASRPAAPPPPYIYHSSVNDPAQDTLAASAQVNPTIIDLGGGNLVAAFEDTNKAGGENSQRTGYAYSSNNGFNWTDAGSLPVVPAGDQGDPTLANHKSSGTVYIGSSSRDAKEMIVFRSSDLGRTFGSPVNAMPDVVPISESIGRTALSVDNFGAAGSGNGNVYACSNPGPSGFTGRVVFTRSIDGGASFGPTGGVAIAAGGGCVMAISPNHQINVFYSRTDDEGVTKIYMKRSRDRGLTFGGEIVVANVSGTSPLDVGGSSVRVTPQVAINPIGARPYIYVTYNDIDPAAPNAKTQIYYVRSTDAGTTWSTPTRVNDDNPGDQYLPTVGIAAGGEQVMFAYYSRSQDPNNIAFHRRGRLGVLTPAGGIAFNPSFQLGPNTPLRVTSDTGLLSLYLGEYDGMTGGSGALLNLWSDNRATNGVNGPQADIYFARITVPPVSADLAVSISASPGSIGRGDEVAFTLTAQALSGTANDVFVSTTTISGLVPRYVSAASGQCSLTSAGVGCSLGSIAAGASKTVRFVAAAPAAGAVTLNVIGSTSSVDTTTANNSASASVTVTNGGVANSNHSSGSIAVAIPDGGSVEVPIEVGSVGNFVSAVAKVRLDHTYDSDLKIDLVSPTGQVVALSNQRGGSGDNYGSGPNDCTGTFTTFRDDVATPISAGTAPLAGNFKPEQPLGGLFRLPTEGTWKLRVADLFTADTGTIGCFQLTITRKP